MKNAIIVHGRPDKDEYYSLEYPAQSNQHWIPWLQKRLQAKDVFTQTPEMPMAFRPNYETWKNEFERFDITPETILVGHSCGGGFLVRWLSENKDKKVGNVVLVAPWINPDDNPASETGDFFYFDIDPQITARTSGLTIFYSSDDKPEILETVKILKSKVKGIGLKEFHGYKHFCFEDMGTVEFPELLAECLAE